MDCNCSIAHLADFQVRSSFKCSKKPVVRSWKRELKHSITPKTTAVRSYVSLADLGTLLFQIVLSLFCFLEQRSDIGKRAKSDERTTKFSI
jgi:hypothetical protein